MRKKKSPHAPSLRGSVTQSNVSVRMRAREASGTSFLTRLGLLFGGLIFTGFFLLWLFHTGWPQRQGEAIADLGLTATQKADFSVRDIVIEGRHQSNRDDIYDALATKRGAPIFGFDMQAATDRLGKLPWVGSAIVERRLPGTIAVILTERTPAARWQHDDKLYVIDNQGQVLTSAKPEDFAILPLVVGTGAEKATQGLFTALQNYPDIQQKTESAVWVGERRWDLHLAPKIIVRLPEDDIDAALHRLSVLISQEKLLDRDIVAVDLRIPDRLTIEPVAHAAANTAPAKDKHP